MTARRVRLLVGALLAGGAPALAQTADTVTVTVEGQPMRLIISGTGGPSVLLEAGSPGDHRTWSSVHPLLAGTGRVVSYDRLGMGASGRSTRPRTAAVIAEQLRDALRRAGVHPPFIAVGHSFGGAVMRVFASRHPGEVAGLVLVDPAMEAFYPRAAREQPAAYLEQLEQEIGWSDGAAGEGVRREFLAYETSMLQARTAELPAGLPIVVLTATAMELPEPLRLIWLDEQRQWAERNGARWIPVESGHRMPQTHPAVVVDAIAAIRHASEGPSR